MAIVPLSFTGGVNLFQDKRLISDDEVTKAENLLPTEPGRLRTRSASTISGIVTQVGVPLVLQYLPANASAAMLVISRSTQTPYSTRFGLFPDPDGTIAGVSPLLTADFGIASPGIPSVIVYQGRVYIFAGYGTNCTGKLVQVTGVLGVTDFTFSTSGNGDLRPTAVGVYTDRFVYMNFGPGFESAIVVADPYNPAAIGANALATNGFYFLANPNDGDRIVGGVEILQTGANNAQASFIILKEHSAYLMSGQPKLSDGTGTDTVQITRMPINCGCASKETIVRTKDGIIWAGPDDVWAFPEGQLPYQIGTKIRPVLQSGSASSRYRWHAVYDQGFYKLAVHSPGQGAADDDPCGEQWWLDLREGIPRNWREARWWGPQIYKLQSYLGGDAVLGTNCMAVDTRPAGRLDLYGLEPTAGGDAIMQFMSYGDGGSHDGAYDFNTEADDKLVQTDTQVIGDLITKEYATIVDGGSIVADSIMEKGLGGIELDCFPSRTGRLAWQWILNRGKTTSAEQTVDVTASGFILGTGVLDTDPLHDERQPLALDPAPERAVGTGIQVRIYGKPGYYIDGTNDLFTFRIEEVAGAAYPEAVLAHGHYESLTDLYSELSRALNDAIALASPTSHSVLVTQSAGKIQIQFTDMGGTVIYISHNYGAGFPSTAKEARMRALVNLLGYTEWDDFDYTGSLTWTAQEKLFEYDVPTWELGGSTISFYVIPRRKL